MGGGRIERMSMSDEEITSLIESEIEGVLSAGKRSVTSGTGGGQRRRRARKQAHTQSLTD